MEINEIEKLLSLLNLLHSKLKIYRKILFLQEISIKKCEISQVSHYAHLEKETARELIGLKKVIFPLEQQYCSRSSNLDKCLIKVRISIDNLLNNIVDCNLSNQKLMWQRIKILEKNLLVFRQNQSKGSLFVIQSSPKILDVFV